MKPVSQIFPVSRKCGDCHWRANNKTDKVRVNDETNIAALEIEKG